ncbi:hypothetical protein BH09PSE1_BH09PSE1_10860 [soil metagenome]
MKRAISGDWTRGGWTLLASACVLALAACSSPARQPTQASAEASDWVTTPMIRSAERTGQGLTLRGMAAPAGRVVVRGASGVAYATGADDQGRFALSIGAPATDTLFVVETQVGQEAIPAPYRLLVAAGPGGPIALLTPGGPSRRLDQTGPLDVVDGDGRALLASGRAGPCAVVPVSQGGGAPVSLRTGLDGRWVDQMDAGATSISVGGRSYVRPSSSPPSAATPLSVTPVPGGRLVNWGTPGGASQQSWFPDAG